MPFWKLALIRWGLCKERTEFLRFMSPMVADPEIPGER